MSTRSETPISYVLLTGATGFIGAHVLDILLQKGLRVRIAVRNLEKARLLKSERPEYTHMVDAVQVADFATATSFTDAVRDVQGIIHVASVSPASPCRISCSYYGGFHTCGSKTDIFAILGPSL